MAADNVVYDATSQSTCSYVSCRSEPAEAYLSVINVTNCTNIHMGLRPLERSVCAVDVCEASSVLLLKSRL